VDSLEPWWDHKHGKKIFPENKPYEDIHMPKNTGIGVIIGIFAFGLGFGLIWYMWWLVIASGLGIFACIVARSFDQEIDYYVPAKEVERIENELAIRREKA
jgi:cytochrome o ubiquinol oxidase subunit 1